MNLKACPLVSFFSIVSYIQSVLYRRFHYTYKSESPKVLLVLLCLHFFFLCLQLRKRRPMSTPCRWPPLPTLWPKCVQWETSPRAPVTQRDWTSRLPTARDSMPWAARTMSGLESTLRLSSCASGTVSPRGLGRWRRGPLEPVGGGERSFFTISGLLLR